jgi:hypothetical protein
LYPSPFMYAWALLLVSSFLLSPPESSLYFLSYIYVPRDAPSTILLDRIARIIFGKEYKTWSSHVCIFYSIIFLFHSYDKMLFSAPCSPTPSPYILPLTCKIDFYFHIKPRAKLLLFIIFNLYYCISEDNTRDSWHTCISKCFSHTGVHKPQAPSYASD